MRKLTGGDIVVVENILQPRLTLVLVFVSYPMRSITTCNFHAMNHASPVHYQPCGMDKCRRRISPALFVSRHTQCPSRMETMFYCPMGPSRRSDASSPRPNTSGNWFRGCRIVCKYPAPCVLMLTLCCFVRCHSFSGRRWWRDGSISVNNNLVISSGHAPPSTYS
jgi:hypothetical protein